MQIDKKDKIAVPTQRAPLEREAPVPLKRPVTPSQNRDDLFNNRKIMNFTDSTGFHGGPSARRKGYRLALWSWLASVIDGLILISASCIFITAFSLIMKSSLGALIGDVLNNQSKVMVFFEVFFVFAWIYMVSVRSLMGSTIGEWSCELRLGQPHERLQSSYVLKVALRSTLILLTGVITLPLLSLIFGRDVAGAASGLKLFSLK